MSAITSSGKRSRIPRGVAAFEHYYVGIDSLDQIATKDDRVCVLNISGGESRTVTPVSHVYSGGNIACGTMPGRSGSVMIIFSAHSTAAAIGGAILALKISGRE